MKKVLLLMVVSALLATLGLAQTPDAGSNTDPANVKGCLGGTDGNYTVAEDGSRQIFKITSSSVDLKPHVGHDVKLIGHKASGTVSTGAADSSFAVTELSMISEHCAAAAAASVGAVVPYSETVIEPSAAPAAPAATASTPPVDAAAPAATVSPSSATVSTPAVDAAVPAATVSPSSATASTPAVEVAAPAATAIPSSATVSSPAVEATHPARSSAHARKRSATQDAADSAPVATVNPSSEPVSPAAADAPPPAAVVSPSAGPVAAPDAAAPDAVIPAAAPTHRAGSLTLLIAFVVLVVLLGTTAPLIGRWRKRKMLERNGSPNLSFTNDTNGASVNEASSDGAGSDGDKPASRKVA